MNRLLARAVSWLRPGYPHGTGYGGGIRQSDHLPLLALLSRRLSSDEVIAVARRLARPEGRPDYTDVAAEILRLTDRLPSPTDVERVRALAWELR